MTTPDLDDLRGLLAAVNREHDDPQQCEVLQAYGEGCPECREIGTARMWLGIAAERALPKLLDRVRELEREVERLQLLTERGLRCSKHWKHPRDCCKGSYTAYYVSEGSAKEIERLREQLATAGVEP